MQTNHSMHSQDISVSPQELLLLPIFMHMSRSGIYYKYHSIKRHVKRAPHLPLRISDLAHYLEEPIDTVLIQLKRKKMVG